MLSAKQQFGISGLLVASLCGAILRHSATIELFINYISHNFLS